MIAAPSKSRARRARAPHAIGRTRKPSAVIASEAPARSWEIAVRPVAAAMLAILAVCALAATIGADARWMAALGRVIAARHGIPTGVPFASAPSRGWANAIALGELIFRWLEAGLGDRGLVIAQLGAVAFGWSLLARDSLMGGAQPSGTALALVVAAVGVLPSLAIVRAQLFSLALFPALLLILRDDARSPSSRIWLCVPLLALWSNLHGAALTGLGVTIIYLALGRARRSPATALGVGVTASLAMCLTPAGLSTPDYYYGVLTNVAAQRGEGLWSPLSFGHPFDVVMIVAGSALVGSALYAWRARPPLWELAVIIALAGLTVHASRSGVWLLAFLVGPAGAGPPVARSRKSVSISVAALAAAGLVVSVARGPLPNGADQGTLARAIAIAHGEPILATDIIAEQIALTGGRVWVSNPVDAFSKGDQATFLDWLDGIPSGRRALRSGINVVLVATGSPADALMSRTAGFGLVQSDRRSRLYVRVT
jgi:hypothetical protein